MLVNKQKRILDWKDNYKKAKESIKLKIKFS